MTRHLGTRRLETGRLILRRFTAEDARDMYANWASDPAVTEFLTWPTHTSEEVSRQVLEQWVRDYESERTYQWAVVSRETGGPIGSLAVVRLDDSVAEAELGWCIGARWWGQGYMPEAAAAVVRFLFDDVGMNRICAKHDVDNPKSGRVMQKLGMRLEGVRRQGGLNNRGIVDLACYAMLRTDERPLG